MNEPLDDMQPDREHEWRLRVRAAGPRRTEVSCRDVKFSVGPPASLGEKNAHPSAVEVLLGALGGDLSTGFAAECAKRGLDVDPIELNVCGRLHDAAGREDGDPSFTAIEIKCYATTLDDVAQVRGAWDATVRRSPVAATLAKATTLDHRLSVL